MAAFSQKIFSDAVSWMKSFVFLLKFHWKLVPKGQIDNNSTCSDDYLAPNRPQAIFWTNADLGVGLLKLRSLISP